MIGAALPMNLQGPSSPCPAAERDQSGSSTASWGVTASQPADPAASKLDFLPNFSCLSEGNGRLEGKPRFRRQRLLLFSSPPPLLKLVTCHVKRLAESSGNCEALMFPRL